MIGNQKSIRFNPLSSASSVLPIDVAQRRRRKSSKHKTSVVYSEFNRCHSGDIKIVNVNKIIKGEEIVISETENYDINQ